MILGSKFFPFIYRSCAYLYPQMSYSCHLCYVSFHIALEIFQILEKRASTSMLSKFYVNFHLRVRGKSASILMKKITNHISL